MCGAVGKSGSPISRWMTFPPASSMARARARTSNADSVPSLDMRSASRISVMPQWYDCDRIAVRAGSDGSAVLDALQQLQPLRGGEGQHGPCFGAGIPGQRGLSGGGHLYTLTDPGTCGTLAPV